MGTKNIQIQLTTYKYMQRIQFQVLIKTTKAQKTIQNNNTNKQTKSLYNTFKMGYTNTNKLRHILNTNKTPIPQQFFYPRPLPS